MEHEEAFTAQHWELLDYLCHALPGQEVQLLTFLEGLEALVRNELWLDFGSDITLFREWKMTIHRRVVRQMNTERQDWNPIFYREFEIRLGVDAIQTFLDTPDLFMQALTIIFCERQPFKSKLIPLYHLQQMGYRMGE